MASQYSVVNRKMFAVCQVSGKFFGFKALWNSKAHFLEFLSGLDYWFSSSPWTAKMQSPCNRPAKSPLGKSFYRKWASRLLYYRHIVA